MINKVTINKIVPQEKKKKKKLTKYIYIIIHVASGWVIVRIFLLFDNNSINNKATTLCLHT